jgi:DNA-binding transcriptional LysR family regulator
MLDPQRVELLRQVSELGTIAAAADAAGYSASAVSQQLSALERESGLALLEREARSVRLTEAGRVLVEHAAPALGALRDAHAAARAAAGLSGGRLRIGTFPSAGAALVPRALGALQARYPQLCVQLTDVEPVRADAAILADHLDAAVTHEHELLPLHSAPRGIRRDVLLREPLSVIVGPAHPLAARRRVRLAELAGERWIADTDATGRDAITEAACRRAGFEPSVAYRTSDTLVTAGLVREGLGVALLPAMAVVAAGPGLRPLALQPPIRRTVHLTWRAAASHPGVGALAGALREALN